MNTLEIKIILNIFNLIIILSSISINCDENLFIKENSISPSLNPPIRDNNINNIDQLLNKEDSIAVTYIKNEKEIPSYLLDDLSDFTPLITNENNNKTVINNELPFESINEVSYIFNKNKENKEICEYFPSILNNEFIKLNELKSNSFYIIEFFNSNNKKANYELNYLDDKTKKQITPYLFIKNILKDQLFYILEYSINNLPCFLQDFKYSEISNIENIKSKENYKVIKNCKLFFDRHFFIKISINHSIYLINLIPKLIFIEEIDFINKKYIKKINQWKCSIYDFNLFKDNNFNTININEDIKLEKKYEIKKNIFLKDNNKLLVRDFLNKNGRIYDKIPKK